MNPKSAQDQSKVGQYWGRELKSKNTFFSFNRSIDRDRIKQLKSTFQVRSGSITSFRACTSDFRLCPDSGHIAASRQASKRAKGNHQRFAAGALALARSSALRSHFAKSAAAA